MSKWHSVVTLCQNGGMRSASITRLQLLSDSGVSRRDVYHNESYIRALEAAAGDKDEELARIARETLKEIKAKSANVVPSTHPEPDIDRH
jgi:hypothetical protein